MKNFVYIVVLLELFLAGLIAPEARAQSGASKPAQGASQQEGQTGLPKETQAMLDRLRQKMEREAEIAERLGRAHSLYQEGAVLSKKGDRKAAEAKFDLARQTVLSVEEEVFYEPGVREYFLKLSRDIAALTEATALPFASESQIAPAGAGQVQQFIKYFLGKGRDSVRVALSRLSRYEQMMRKIFREEGVPEDLIYVGLVESAYNPYAQSVAGAAGIWQFVRGTGRRYGLKQAGAFDERHDPEKSTRAAARYLRDLFGMFGDWHLALAAYNAGAYRVLKVIEKTGIKDFWHMSGRGLLPQETISYVPAVLAAIAIGKQGPERRQAPRTARTNSRQTAPEVGREGNW
jgi:soluble lytic murein transglycosylase-like protein